MDLSKPTHNDTATGQVSKQPTERKVVAFNFVLYWPLTFTLHPIDKNKEANIMQGVAIDNELSNQTIHTPHCLLTENITSSDNKLLHSI